MIKTQDAIRAARSLIGTPYGTGSGELDCINLIKRIIRTAPGGRKDYTTAGTNGLWDSAQMSAKYRDLTWRQEGIAGARAGMLAFKRSGSDVHHAGLVTGEGTVIHASGPQGQYRQTVETALTAGEGWNLLAIHRDIEVSEGAKEETGMTRLYEAMVTTKRDPLRVREWPKNGTILGHVPKERTVDVIGEAEDGWTKIRYGELEGYVSAKYLQRLEGIEAPETSAASGGNSEAEEDGEPGVTDEEIQITEEAVVQIVITDEAGNVFRPVGDYTVRIEITVSGDD